MAARRRVASTEEGRESIGERLARLRKVRGITQVELAALLDTTQSLVSKYERGDLLLHGELIVRLAAVLHVSTDELLGAESKAGKAAPLPFITERRLVHRVERLQRLPRRQKEALLRTIDAFLTANGDGRGRAA